MGHLRFRDRLFAKLPVRIDVNGGHTNTQVLIENARSGKRKNSATSTGRIRGISAFCEMKRKMVSLIGAVAAPPGL